MIRQLKPKYVVNPNIQSLKMIFTGFFISWNDIPKIVIQRSLNPIKLCRGLFILSTPMMGIKSSRSLYPTKIFFFHEVLRFERQL